MRLNNPSIKANMVFSFRNTQDLVPLVQLSPTDEQRYRERRTEPGEQRPDTYREVYCRHHGIPLPQFESHCLFQAWHRRSLRAARFLHQKKPKWFASEYDLLRRLGNARTMREVRFIIANYHLLAPRKNLLFRPFRFRLSCQRLLRMAVKLPGFR